MIDKEIIDNFRNGLKKDKVEDPIKWMAENIKLPFSQRSTKPDIKNWMVPVLRSLTDPKVEITNLCAPTGSGKSTIGNLWIGYNIKNDPRNMLICYQNEREAETWATTQLDSFVKGSELLKPLIPTAKGKNMKMYKGFPGSDIFIGSANLGFLQSKSVRSILADECAFYQPGMIGQLLKRNHDCWNASNLFISQASEATQQNDWHDLFNSGNVHEWFFKCPTCGNFHLPDFVKNMNYTISYDSENQINWHDTHNSVFYKCPECGEMFNDTITNRSNLANNGKYVLTKKGIEKINSFHINILACPVEWKKIVTEYIIADNEFKRGFDQLKKDFWLKRLSLFWNDEEHMINVSTFEETEETPEIKNADGLLGYCLSVDVQKTHLWALLCAAYNDLIVPVALHKLLTFEELEELQEQYKISNKQVWIDARYRSASVFELCNRKNYIAIMGSNKKHFLHNVGNQKVYKYFSPVQTTQGQRGNRQQFLYMASQGLEHLFFDLKESGVIKIPKDADPEMKKQLSSTIRKTVYDAKGRSKQEIITRIKDNHAFDCLKNALCNFYIRGWLPGNVKMPDPSEAENESEKDLEEKDGSEGQKVRKYQLNQ